jgi:hypothetical protein
VPVDERALHHLYAVLGAIALEQHMLAARGAMRARSWMPGPLSRASLTSISQTLSSPAAKASAGSQVSLVLLAHLQGRPGWADQP